MILDSSVVVAIVRREPGYEDLRSVLAQFLEDFGVAIVSFGPDHWREAARAFRHFGKGRHPAALSFGDRLTYAVARLAERPLLCLGDDFRQSDLLLA